MIPFPNKKYQIIYADPPWRYNFPNNKYYKVENHYPSMSINEICSLKIPSDNNCVTFLWATAPKLLEALKVMKAWGFNYKTQAVWDKVNEGLGYWFRGQHEILLVGTKGKFSPPKVSDRKSSIFVEKKHGHSIKPYCVRNWINKAFPDLSKIELFARPPKDRLFEDESYKGWDLWGNEV